MARMHSRQDVYINDVLAWEGALVVDNNRNRTLRVKLRGAFIATYTDTEYLGRDGAIHTWNVTDPDGVRVVFASAGRTPAGCIPCGAKR